MFWLRFRPSWWADPAARVSWCGTQRPIVPAAAAGLGLASEVKVHAAGKSAKEQAAALKAEAVEAAKAAAAYKKEAAKVASGAKKEAAKAAAASAKVGAAGPKPKRPAKGKAAKTDDEDLFGDDDDASVEE